MMIIITQRDRHLAYLGWVRYLARSRLVEDVAIYLQTIRQAIELVDTLFGWLQLWNVYSYALAAVSGRPLWLDPR